MAKEEHRLKILLLIMMLLTFPLYCFANDNSMIIGNIELRLGMPKDKIIDLFLQSNYLIRPVGDEGDFYQIDQKDKINIFPFASLRFENNNLAYITTRWYYTDTDNGSFELVDKIFDLLKQEAQNGYTIKPVVKLSSSILPSGKVDLIDIIFDNKTINYRIYITKDGKDIRKIIGFKSIGSQRDDDMIATSPK